MFFLDVVIDRSLQFIFFQSSMSYDVGAYFKPVQKAFGCAFRRKNIYKNTERQNDSCRQQRKNKCNSILDLHKPVASHNPFQKSYE